MNWEQLKGLGNALRDLRLLEQQHKQAIAEALTEAARLPQTGQLSAKALIWGLAIDCLPPGSNPVQNQQLVVQALEKRIWPFFLEEVQNSRLIIRDSHSGIPVNAEISLHGKLSPETVVLYSELMTWAAAVLPRGSKSLAIAPSGGSPAVAEDIPRCRDLSEMIAVLHQRFNGDRKSIWNFMARHAGKPEAAPLLGFREGEIQYQANQRGGIKTLNWDAFMARIRRLEKS